MHSRLVADIPSVVTANLQLVQGAYRLLSELQVEIDRRIQTIGT